MQSAFIIPIIYVLSMGSGYAPIETHPTASQGTDWLQYHNGTPVWGCYQGAYRGVWFNVLDFCPGSAPLVAAEVEMWFYHSSVHPWDTGDVYIELWTGDADGPTSMLDQTLQTAVHCTPVYVEYDPEIPVDYDFWILANPAMSAGGWPSIASDGNHLPVAHSFYLNGSAWIPWEYNFFASCAVYPDPNDLHHLSWASIKTVF